MNRFPALPITAVADQDLADQARPGHGIPSQDPDPSAQFPQTRHEAGREANSMLMAGGLMAGVATGAAIGVVVAGPAGAAVGAAVGAALGGAAGGLGGAAAGAAVTTQGADAADSAPAPCD